MANETKTTKIMGWTLTIIFACAVAVGTASFFLGGSESGSAPATNTAPPSSNNGSW